MRSFITSTTLNRQNCRVSGSRRARLRRNEESRSKEGKIDGKDVGDSRAGPGKGNEGNEGREKKVVARTPL